MKRQKDEKDRYTKDKRTERRKNGETEKLKWKEIEAYRYKMFLQEVVVYERKGREREKDRKEINVCFVQNSTQG